MEVYKSSFIPPFKETDFVINNVKTTELDPAKEKRALGVRYSINVEDFNNNKTILPIISYRSIFDAINQLSCGRLNMLKSRAKR